MSEKALLSLKREAQDYLFIGIFWCCIFLFNSVLLFLYIYTIKGFLDGIAAPIMMLCLSLVMAFISQEQYRKAKHSIYKVYSDKIYISDFLRYTVKEISMEDITEITYNSKQIVFKTDEEEYYFEGIKNITENYEKIKQIYEDYKNSKNMQN